MNLEPKSIFTSQKDFGSQSGPTQLSLPRRHSIQVTSYVATAPFPPITFGRSQQSEKGADATSSVKAQIVTLGAEQNTESHDPKSLEVAHPSIDDELTGVPDTAGLDSPKVKVKSSRKHLPEFRTPDILPSQLSRETLPATPHASKRPPEENATRPDSISERPAKRVRPWLRARHTLDPTQFQAVKHSPKPGDTTSPLFFSSHSSKHRPAILQEYTSPRLAARMLNKARDESGAITTLKLARGSMSSISSSPRAGTPSNMASFDRRSNIQSPDVKGKSPGMQLLGAVGVAELLEQDERPTFIIDVANPLNFTPGGPLIIIFANASLRGYDSILEMVTGKEVFDNPGIVHDFPEFKSWALSFVKNSESMDVCLPSFSYGGLTWTCSTLRKRLRLFSCSGNSIASGGGSSISNGANPSAASPIMIDRNRGPNILATGRSPLIQLSEPADYFGDVIKEEESIPRLTSDEPVSSPMSTDDRSPPKQAMIAAQNPGLTREMLNTRYPDNSSFDWTRLPLSAALPKHIQFARSIDWASTALGPIENWSFDLRAMCNLIMGSPHPAAMYWGPEYIAIYNEAYIMLAGKKHPHLMGQSYKVAWPEIWDDVEDVFLSARLSGQSTMKDDDCLFVKRNEYYEESYFSWSIVPLIGEDGSVVGLYNPAFDKTRRRIAERRMLTLREIGDRTATAREIKEFWSQVLKGLEYNDHDVPFALIYSVADDNDGEMSSIHSGSLSQAPQCVLEGALGVPLGHKARVSPLDLRTSDDGFAPYLRESQKTGRPVLLTVEEGTLSADLLEGIESRGWGDACRAVVICPIHPTTGESILGFLVIGVNPRRPYDDDYSLFIQLISRQLATSMASVVLFEEEIRRGQRAARLAALDRLELSKQLDLRTKEKMESETKFTRMAEFAPVGMFIADSAGQVTYSNDTWWEISRHPRTTISANTWMDSIKDEDRKSVENIWNTLVDRKIAVTHEFRFKTPWQDRNGNMTDTWVLMSAYPEKDESGRLKSIFGSITNISSQKSAEDFQKKRMEEAMELKRQQENFIDMTSHEMRNPLSAILQCSDEISTSLIAYKAANPESRSEEQLVEILEGSIDASQTIALCAQHQKRIVDDILTLSKLDSALLAVTPVDVYPVEVVQRALKMFEGELETNDISMQFQIEQSYLDLQVGRVKLDPSRLLQVLINLTTNAIKFSAGAEKRTIVVTIGASSERPSGTESGVTYFPSRSKTKDMTTDDAEWGTGDNIFLLFAVADTGRGLDEQEKVLLFQRFRQASPRTHVQYGGSGLGLFISRELTELQGGEIGVASERGVGSTFAFYVRARKVRNDPEDATVANKMSTLRRNSSNSAVVMDTRRGSSGKSASRSSGNEPIHRKRSPNTSVEIARVDSPGPSLDFGKTKVLIVEDNLVNQKVLQKQLKNVGFLVEVANHGGEALDILRTSRFWNGNEKNGNDLAVVLMDLEMPIMDGLTATMKIRELETAGTIVKHVPIIAVTANARLEQIETAMSAGMDDVVSKPFRIPELIPKIEELVARSKVPATPAALTSKE